MQDTPFAPLANSNKSEETKDSVEMVSNISEKTSPVDHLRGSKLSCTSQLTVTSVIGSMTGILSNIKRWSDKSIRLAKEPSGVQGAELEGCDPTRPIIRTRMCCAIITCRRETNACS